MNGAQAFVVLARHPDWEAVRATEFMDGGTQDDLRNMLQFTVQSYLSQMKDELPKGRQIAVAQAMEWLFGSGRIMVLTDSAGEPGGPVQHGVAAYMGADTEASAQEEGIDFLRMFLTRLTGNDNFRWVEGATDGTPEGVEAGDILRRQVVRGARPQLDESKQFVVISRKNGVQGEDIQISVWSDVSTKMAADESAKSLLEAALSALKNAQQTKDLLPEEDSGGRLGGGNVG